jgi:pimeloyl-ACP methyl ester carboxylesterase
MKMPPLILIHGYPFDHTMWDAVIDVLGDQVETLAPDLPGFGDTSVAQTDPSIDAYADFIVRLLDNHQIETAVFAGMSMGGYVVLSLAERHSERLGGMALVNTQTIADTDEGRKGRRDMIRRIREQGPGAAAQAALPKLFSPANADNPRLAQFARHGAEKAGVDGLSWALEAMARRPDRTAIAATVGVPALVLHGALDQFVPVERARSLAHRIPDAKYAEVADAGHASPLEAPHAVAEALRDLVKRAASYSPRETTSKLSRPPITIAPGDHGL